MLKIVDQLSACLCESCSSLCKWFSHYLEKDIENFIYIRDTEFLLLVHNIQNIISSHLKKWFYYLLIFKIIYVTQICLWFFWKEAALQYICFLLCCESNMSLEIVAWSWYYFRIILWSANYLQVCCCLRITTEFTTICLLI